MIRNYRKRFVISVMVMVGLALLITFLVLSYAIQRNEYNSLKNTMALLIRPWDSPGESFKTLDKGGLPQIPEGEKPEDMPDGEKPGDTPQGEKPDADIKPPEGSEPPEALQDRTGQDPGAAAQSLSNEIATVIYDRSSGEISVLSDDSFIESTDISGAVEEIAELDKEFGTLRSYGLIYYKDGTGNNLQIALASTSYIRAKMARSVIMLSLAYAAAMVLVLFISVKLSKTAAKPMEDAVEMERQFVADISHDLKTPITVVLANNSILRSGKDQTVADQMQWIDSTDEAAKNMLTLVSEMLDLSQLESSERVAERESTDLSQLAEKCVLQMESVAFERGVQLESDIDEGLAAVSDRNYVQRIFSSLIENALKYEPMGGKVNVTLKKERRKAVFSVVNSGSTISAEDLPHIFERFYRGKYFRIQQSRPGHQLYRRLRPVVSTGTGQL